MVERDKKEGRLIIQQIVPLETRLNSLLHPPLRSDGNMALRGCIVQGSTARPQ